MAKPLCASAPDATPVALLHRRKPRVVVRAGDSWSPAPAPTADRRAHAPTIPGLGFRAPEDTLETLDDSEVELVPASQVRPRVTPRRLPPLVPPPRVRSRPATLIDGVHDSLARDYLEEAERLIASGIFNRGSR